MNISAIVLSELKGSVNSNPQILCSYPYEINYLESSNLIHKFLPFGSQAGDCFESRIAKERVISYVFKIKNYQGRDDLMSMSLITSHKDELETGKLVLKEIVEIFEKRGKLNEIVLETNLKSIFVGIEGETEITTKELTVDLEKIFAQVKPKEEKKKQSLKGALF